MSHVIGKSLNITWNELACKDGTPYPLDFIKDGRVIELIVMFERIRYIWGKPIIVNSAYRTPAYNKRVGGATRSQHLEGKALDLQPPDGVLIEVFYSTIKHYAMDFGVRGLGKYPTFIHVDIRDSKELVTWSL